VFQYLRHILQIVALSLHIGKSAADEDGEGASGLSISHIFLIYVSGCSLIIFR